MFNKRGTNTIEYAVLLAMSIGAFAVFDPTDFHQLVTHPFTKAESIVEHKTDIATSDGFWKAINADKTTITVGKTTYTGIYDYMKRISSNLTSGSIGTDFVGTDKPIVDGHQYNHASGPIHDILTGSNYIGHEDITWSVIDKKLYIYENSKLNLTDNLNHTYTATMYNLKDTNPQPQEAAVQFVKGKGDYGYIKPI